MRRRLIIEEIAPGLYEVRKQDAARGCGLSNHFPVKIHCQVAGDLIEDEFEKLSKAHPAFIRKQRGVKKLLKKAALKVKKGV